ncbi:restriction endonuclease subunit S [Bacteroides fragilis]|uniref:restriction endonuclease subunit S n=1 Tax=Bacteroides fragilis TaxID=817 RepID=UPI001CE1549F|nr:restriction endonuclease subunit S [Bacteroides fragilis]MCA5607670.1 restriction endonuclease subunit S [Bacteroides fragilis]
MNGKQLKNSILQWAIQGKLVQQDPNDEPASVLLEHIREEKAKLVKEKKIKKDKNESIIYRGDDNSYYEKIIATGEVKCIDEEIPFEIPKGWEWCRLRQITSLLGDGIHGTPEYDPNGEYYFVNGNNLQDKKIVIKPDTKKVSREEYLKYKKNLNKHTVLVSINGTLGNIGFYNDEPIMLGKKNHLAPNVAKIEPLDDSIFLDYAVFALMSPCGQRGVNAIKKSTAQPSLSMETIRKLLIPIPPFKEQKCISLKLSEVLPLVEKYSKVQKVQNQINDEINILLSKSILQEAIRGKLVPQIAEEGTADKLLAEIHKEKERLVKEGKLKKAILTDSVIYKGDDNKYYERIGGKDICIDDEILFEIPDSWVWCRLGFLFNHNTGKALNASNKEGSMLPYITTSNLYWGQFDLSSVRQMYFKDSEIEKCSVSNGDLLVCEGGDIGRAAIWPYDTPMCIQNHIHKLRSYNQLDTLFYYYIFQAYKYNGYIGGKGIGIQGLSSKALHNMLVPLPPINEQIRITSKISSLFQFI